MACPPEGPRDGVFRSSWNGATSGIRVTDSRSTGEGHAASLWHAASMDPRVLVAVALVALGVGIVLNLVFLRKNRNDAADAKTRPLIGGASVCYGAAGLVLLVAAFQF